MNLIEISIAFVAAIVSVGAPLVFEAISKFDDKYKSDEILDLFEKKSNKRLFQVLIICMVCIVAIYILISIFTINSDNPQWNTIINYFAFVLLSFSFVLISLFVHFTFVSIKFSRPSKLQKYLIILNKRTYKPTKKKFNAFAVVSKLQEKLKLTLFRKETTNQLQIKSLNSLTHFIIFTIQKKDFLGFQKLINHFIDVFDKLAVINKMEHIPEIYYEIGYKITKELTTYKERDYDLYKNLTVNNLWLMNKLDKSDYSWLWQNLKVAIENNETELVFYYWKKAFSHIQYHLREVEPIYESFPSIIRVNQKEIDTRIKEREEFKEFHYYLGALLLFQKQHKLIRRIWNYTDSQPPRYHLLPSTMSEIFTLYFKFSKYYDSVLFQKSILFRFPKSETINADSVVNSWVRKNLVLLFLRQYTLHQYYTFENFFMIPDTPPTQSEKKHWIENVSFFKESVKEYLKNEELLKELQLDFINKTWCEENNKIYPLKFIKNLKEKLEESFIKAKKEQPISPEKEKAFLSKSKKIIDNTFKNYTPVLNKESIENTNVSTYILGSEQLFLKSDFADNQEYENLDFDNLLANRLGGKIKNKISESFVSATTHKYLLKEEDIFSAINNLNIVSEAQNFIIVAFKINLNYYSDVLKIESLNNNNYKGIEIQHYWNCNANLAGGTFFILQKSDLPHLNFDEPTRNYKNTFEEKEKIIPEKKIHAAVIDLYKETEIRNFIETRDGLKDMEDKVLSFIEMKAEIRWKEKAKIIALRISTTSEDRGIPNKPEEVKPFYET